MRTLRRSRKRDKKEPSPPAQTDGYGIEWPRQTAPVKPARRKIQFSADGMIEERPASGWARPSDLETEDLRTLAELAASVMGAQRIEALEAPEVPTVALTEPEFVAESDRAQELIAVELTSEKVLAEVTTGDARRRIRQRGAGAVVLLLAVIALLGVAWLRSNVGGSASVDPDPGQLVAAPAEGGPPIDGSVLPAPDASSSQEGTVIPPVAPTPEPEAAAAPVAPHAVEPDPISAPTPAPAPPPPPPATPPTVHIGDLDGGPKGAKVFVQIWVHDASHNPVAGATVSLAWGGASGQPSCVTDASGSCTVHTNNLSSPASLTLTVTGVSASGATYDAAANHDPDGDSSGTSITVSF